MSDFDTDKIINVTR